MGAGKYRNRITFQNSIVTADGYNEQILTWADHITLWAAAHTSGSREFYQAQKMFAEVSMVFEIRYRTDINERQRIKYGNQYYEILGKPVDVEGRHRELQVYAKEVA